MVCTVCGYGLSVVAIERKANKQTLIDVWRQALVENADVVELGSERYPVQSTPKRGVRQVDFTFEGNEIRGREQNPETKNDSTWRSFSRDFCFYQAVCLHCFPTFTTQVDELHPFDRMRLRELID